MAYKYDPYTRAITISAGDTMDFSVNVSGKSYDAAVFAVYDPDTGDDVVTVPAELAENQCKIRLAARHTMDVPAGKYKWNIRLVSNPEKDEDGNIVLNDDTDNSLTVFGPEKNEIPDFIVRRTGAYV